MRSYQRWMLLHTNSVTQVSELRTNIRQNDVQPEG